MTSPAPLESPVGFRKVAGGAVSQRRTHDLRYDVAGPLHDHVVARPDVFAMDVVLVMQGGSFDRDPADLDRFEDGERREHAGAAHVDLDAVQARDGGGRRELEGDRPARVVGDLAEVALQGDVVDLHDHAVDVVVDLPRRSTQAAHSAITCSIVSWRADAGFTRKPCARSHSSDCQWLSTSSPSL